MPDPTDCFTAQTVPQNGPMDSDVGGFAVGIANIMINLCLSVLVKWSYTPEGPMGYTDDLLNSFFGLFSQVYPILLATTASIGRSKLTLFEAHFAVAVSASPVSVYLAYMAFHDVYRNPGILFHIMGDTRKAAALWLGILLPSLWLALNLVVSFDSKAFKDSRLCEDVTFLRWIEFLVVSNFVGVLDVMGRRDLWNDFQGRGGLGAVSVTTLWVWGVYFVRHLARIWDEVVDRARIDRRRTTKFYLRIPIYIFSLARAPWDVIAEEHPWLVLVIVCCLHWSWILGIVRGISLDGYEFSYGQALSAFSVIPPIVATLKLLALRRGDIKKFFVYRLRSDLRSGLVFFFTGEPDDYHSRTTFKSPHWLVPVIFSLLASSSLGAYIVNYVCAGSIPNPRTIVNNPHGNWKPFSIGVYICGFLIGCINVWAWSFYYKRVFGAGKQRLIFPSTYTWFRVLFWFISLIVVVPVAIFMCAGPLFSSFAALPLAQEQQWTHRCDPFQGEAILQGGSYRFQPPLASLYYPHPTNGSDLSKHLEISITQQSDDPGLWTLNLETNASTLQQHPETYTSVRSISYDFNKNIVLATCVAEDMITILPCMQGHFNLSDHFSMLLNDTRTNTETKLRAVDEEWMYNNDAPSFILNNVQPSGILGDIVMETAVTQRSHCEVLKICLASGSPSLDTLVPLGLALWAQDRYSTYCTTPRLYA